MNILVQVTGSISTYKVCDVVSKLIKLDHDVKVCASKASLNFVGEATWEGFTGNLIFSDDFSPGQRMNHIHLNKWADLTLLAPASAKTLNQMHYGVGDGVLNTLWLARDENKPLLIFPAMNPKMWNAPSVIESVKFLNNQPNVKVYEPEVGTMACGDEGVGRLQEPIKIVNECLKYLSSQSRVLVTFGGTFESIDAVREITNFSTGQTGMQLVEELSKIYRVTSVFSERIHQDFVSAQKMSFKSSFDLEEILQKELSENHYSAIYHLAAVSDYVPEEFLDKKIDSIEEKLSLSLKKRDKILNKIRSWSLNKDINIVSFKLSHNQKDSVIDQKIIDQMKTSHSNYVVHNTLTESRSDRHVYQIWSKSSKKPLFQGNAKNLLMKDLVKLTEKNVEV